MKKTTLKFLAIALVVLFMLVILAACGDEDNGTEAEASSSVDNTENGDTSTENVTAHTCTFDQTIVADNYKKSDANCLKKAEYYYSCKCGEKNELTFEAGELGKHLWNANTGECTLCNFIEPFTEGLKFELSDDGKSYTVAGIGTATASDIAIPRAHSGLPVTSIGYRAFLGRKLTSITIPDSVTSIGVQAFYACSKLTSITIPDSVESIGSEVFKGCTSLKYNEDKNGKYLGNEENKYMLLVEVIDKTVTSLEINADTKIIYENAVEECKSLKSITIPNSVTNIGNYAFEDCEGLTNIIIPDSVTSIGVGAFFSCESLESVVIPDSVTSIASYAFYRCTKLTSITIPDSVTSIGSYAFAHCMGVTNIIIPDSVTRIGDNAFAGCDNLKVNEDKNIAYIGNEENKYMVLVGGLDETVTSLEINQNTKLIYSNAFSSCRNLKSITIPDGVISIGDRAFSNCTGLTNIIIPDSVISIGDRAFSNCAGLVSVTIGSGVERMFGSFYNCHKLVEVYNLSSLDITKESTSNGYAGYYALDVYTSLSEPSKLTKTDDEYVFYENGETVYLLGYKGNETELTLPAKFNNKNYEIYKYAFYGIYEYSFYYSPKLTSITIGNGVTSIGEYAFGDCRQLTSITIPDSVISIGDYAFKGCAELVSVTIGSGVESIGSNAFISCEKLVEVYNLSSLDITKGSASNGYAGYHALDVYTSLSEPSKLTQTDDKYIFYENGETVYLLGYIGYKGNETELTLPNKFNNKNYGIYKCAFNYNFEIVSITIPDGVISIGDDAFYYCIKLTSITIPDSVISIGDDAFTHCDLKYNEDKNGKYLGNEENKYVVLIEVIDKTAASFEINQKTKVIYSSAFSVCHNLISITIPNRVTSIGDGAFSSCESLESVVIPDSVTSIGDGAFEGCKGLVSVVISDSVISIGEHAFRDCIQLTSLTIGDSVTSIGDYAFEGCGGLANIIIPDSVTSIGIEAFGNCLYESVTIGKNVESIGDYAFYGHYLTVINFNGTITEWKAIEKGHWWDNGSGNYTVTCTDGKLDKDGNTITE